MTHDQPDPGSGRSQRFAATVVVDRQGRTRVPVPFEPDAVWGSKPRHHVTGTVAGRGVRGALDAGDGGVVLILGPAWSRGCGPADGTTVIVEQRPLRIAEMVRLLEEGKKER